MNTENTTEMTAATAATTPDDAASATPAQQDELKTDAATAGSAQAQAAAETPQTDIAEIARLKAEITRLNNRADTLAKENADQKKQLRSYKSAEEIREEEKREADAERDRKIAEYEKRLAVAEVSKKAVAFLKDEATATAMAEALYGAADADAAIDLFNKAWTANEKRLRIEYGKIPAPGVGGVDAPTVTKDQFAAMGYMERLDIKRKYPELWKQLTN